MNLLIAIVILLVLLVSDMGTIHPVGDVGIRLIAILVTTATVPVLAAFQTAIVTRKFRNSEDGSIDVQRTIQRLTACHSAVWLAASLVIVYSFQWQRIVRGNWALDRWPLIDELLIIAPVVISLIASWAIFFDVQNAFSSPGWISSLGERCKYVAIRVRVYLAIFLVPILIGIAARDVLLSHTHDAKTIASVGMLVGLPILLAVFPFLLLRIWNTDRIDGKEFEHELLTLCQNYRLRIRGIRVWTTGQQIINAVVAGVFPHFRFILISDALIHHFTQPELKAILRHEAGHIRRGHLFSRLLFIVLPVCLFWMGQLFGRSSVISLQAIATELGLPVSSLLNLSIGIYLVYLTLVLRRLSIQMEYDADQFAICHWEPKPTKSPQVDFFAADDMSNALLRFAELMPSQVDRKSFWHPTLRKRLERIERLKRNPELAAKHANEFFHQQFLLFAALVVFATLSYLYFALAGV